MTDRPAIFSSPMVNALLREVNRPGTGKTQTRRIVTSPLAKCQPGDRLYVRENCWLYGCWRNDGTTRTGRQRRTFDLIGRRVTFDKPEPIAFWGGGEGFTWRPAMHQPRWASRLTLVVSDARFQTLQDIAPEDAQAEGVRDWLETQPESSQEIGSCDPVWSYRGLWESLHGTGTWDQNPDVVALTFTVHAANIDTMEAA